MEGLKLDQFLEYTFLSDVRWSPDGARAVFTVKRANREENTYASNLWLYENGCVKQLTGLGKEGCFFWEDDRHILFPADRSTAEKKRREAGDHFTSYYRIATDGGEALFAFSLPIEARELKKAGKGLWYFTADIDSAEPDAFLDTTEQAETRKKAEKEDADFIVLEENPFCHNGDTFTSGKRTALFVYDEAGRETRRLTEPFMDVGSTVYLEGKLYFLGETWKGRPDFREGLFSCDPETGKTETLIEQGILYMGGLETMGSELVLLMTEGDKYGMEETPSFYLVDPESGDRRLFYENDMALYNSTGSDCRLGHGYGMRVRGEEIYVLATVRNACNLMHIYDGIAEPLLDKAESMESFDVSCKGEILSVAMLNGKLQELYRIAEGKAVQITSFNEKVLQNKYVAPYEKISVNSCGEAIDGWILRPMDYDPTKSYPAILDIHGGPRTVYGEVFYHEMQYWAGKGYFIFFCNPRGSDGRGDAFADIWGKYGQTDYRNIMDFTDAVLERYPAIDKSRVAVTGGSYGGFMTNWIIGHTDRFCCAATQRSISNWLSFWGTSDIGIVFGEYQMKAIPDEDPGKMWEQSPLKYMENFKTPTLIIHSDCDYRCPISEGYQLLTALKRKDVDARMVVFKGENHELSRSGKPLHRIRRLKEITDWIDKYTHSTEE